MVTVAAKPLEARRIEARARARTSGVRVREVARGRHYRSVSRTTGEVYDVVRLRDGWACSCLGFTYTSCCKHVAAVERRSERDGWDFGVLARSPQQARRYDG